jgi:hypothetical protein
MADNSQPGIGPQTFANIGAGVSDIFAGFAAETKAQRDILEGQAYGEAAQLAFQNEQFTQMCSWKRHVFLNRPDAPPPPRRSKQEYRGTAHGLPRTL